MIVFKIAASPRPGWVEITLQTETGVYLGKAKMYYYDEGRDHVQCVLNDWKLEKMFFEKFTQKLGSRTSSGEIGNAENPGMLIL